MTSYEKKNNDFIADTPFLSVMGVHTTNKSREAP